MAKIINKWIEKWWWVVAAILLVGIFGYGYKNMFFHQDDLDWFLMMNKPMWQVMAAPLSDHVNYLFRLVFKLEWEAFGLSFPPYLMVSLAMHASVVWLVYVIAKATSGRSNLAAWAALLFSVNTNWNESVLWISGQTILISAVFVLLAMRMILKKRFVLAGIGLACLTSSLALGLPSAVLLTYGVDYRSRRLTKMGWGVLLIMVLVVLVFKWRSTDGTAILMSWRWMIQVVGVAGLGIVHTVLGRLLIPFDRFETIRIVGAMTLIVGVLYKWRTKLSRIWADQWSRFLLWQMTIYYLIVAVGRAQYGIGIMRAERYAYLGLALFLLLLSRVARNWQIGRWVWVGIVIVVLQGAGFYTRARVYVVRPQQMRQMFEQVRQLDPTRCYHDTYLPYFAFQDNHLRYSDLFSLMSEGKHQLGEGDECLNLLE